MKKDLARIEKNLVKSARRLLRRLLKAYLDRGPATDGDRDWTLAIDDLRKATRGLKSTAQIAWAATVAQRLADRTRQ